MVLNDEILCKLLCYVFELNLINNNKNKILFLKKLILTSKISDLFWGVKSLKLRTFKLGVGMSLRRL